MRQRRAQHFIQRGLAEIHFYVSRGAAEFAERLTTDTTRSGEGGLLVRHYRYHFELCVSIAHGFRHCRALRTYGGTQRRVLDVATRVGPRVLLGEERCADGELRIRDVGSLADLHRRSQQRLDGLACWSQLWIVTEA